MLHLEIVTPEKTIFSDTVEDVYLPGEEGEMGVLELHAALVTSLKAGELRYRKDGTVHELAIGNGFAEITQEKVSVLTDMATGEADIDEAAVEAAIKSAEDALHGIKHDDRDGRMRTRHLEPNPDRVLASARHEQEQQHA